MDLQSIQGTLPFQMPPPPYPSRQLQHAPQARDLAASTSALNQQPSFGYNQQPHAPMQQDGMFATQTVFYGTSSVCHQGSGTTSPASSKIQSGYCILQQQQQQASVTQYIGVQLTPIQNNAQHCPNTAVIPTQGLQTNVQCMGNSSHNVASNQHSNTVPTSSPAQPSQPSQPSQDPFIKHLLQGMQLRFVNLYSSMFPTSPQPLHEPWFGNLLQQMELQLCKMYSSTVPTSQSLDQLFEQLIPQVTLQLRLNRMKCPQNVQGINSMCNSSSANAVQPRNVLANAQNAVQAASTVPFPTPGSTALCRNVTVPTAADNVNPLDGYASNSALTLSSPPSSSLQQPTGSNNHPHHQQQQQQSKYQSNYLMQNQPNVHAGGLTSSGHATQQTHISVTGLNQAQAQAPTTALHAPQSNYQSQPMQQIQQNVHAIQEQPTYSSTVKGHGPSVIQAPPAPALHQSQSNYQLHFSTTGSLAASLLNCRTQDSGQMLEGSGKSGTSIDNTKIQAKKKNLKKSSSLSHQAKKKNLKKSSSLPPPYPSLPPPYSRLAPKITLAQPTQVTQRQSTPPSQLTATKITPAQSKQVTQRQNTPPFDGSISANTTRTEGQTSPPRHPGDKTAGLSVQSSKQLSSKEALMLNQHPLLSKVLLTQRQNTPPSQLMAPEIALAQFPQVTQRQNTPHSQLMAPKITPAQSTQQVTPCQNTPPSQLMAPKITLAQPTQVTQGQNTPPSQLMAPKITLAQPTQVTQRQNTPPSQLMAPKLAPAELPQVTQRQNTPPSQLMAPKITLAQPTQVTQGQNTPPSQLMALKLAPAQLPQQVTPRQNTPHSQLMAPKIKLAQSTQVTQRQNTPPSQLMAPKLAPAQLPQVTQRQNTPPSQLMAPKLAPAQLPQVTQRQNTPPSQLMAPKITLAQPMQVTQRQNTPPSQVMASEIAPAHSTQVTQCQNMLPSRCALAQPMQVTQRQNTHPSDGSILANTARTKGQTSSPHHPVDKTAGLTAGFVLNVVPLIPVNLQIKAAGSVISSVPSKPQSLSVQPSTQLFMLNQHILLSNVLFNVKNITNVIINNNTVTSLANVAPDSTSANVQHSSAVAAAVAVAPPISHHATGESDTSSCDASESTSQHPREAVNANSNSNASSDPLTTSEPLLAQHPTGGAYASNSDGSDSVSKHPPAAYDASRNDPSRSISQHQSKGPKQEYKSNDATDSISQQPKGPKQEYNNNDASDSMSQHQSKGPKQEYNNNDASDSISQQSKGPKQEYNSNDTSDSISQQPKGPKQEYNSNDASDSLTMSEVWFLTVDKPTDRDGNEPTLNAPSADQPEPTSDTPALRSKHAIATDAPSQEHSISPNTDPQSIEMNSETIDPPTNKNSVYLDRVLMNSIPFSLEKLRTLVTDIELIENETKAEDVPDFARSILDCYWGGDYRNYMTEEANGTFDDILREAEQFETGETDEHVLNGVIHLGELIKSRDDNTPSDDGAAPVTDAESYYKSFWRNVSDESLDIDKELADWDFVKDNLPSIWEMIEIQRKKVCSDDIPAESESVDNTDLNGTSDNTLREAEQLEKMEVQGAGPNNNTQAKSKTVDSEKENPPSLLKQTRENDNGAPAEAEKDDTCEVYDVLDCDQDLRAAIEIATKCTPVLDKIMDSQVACPDNIQVACPDNIHAESISVDNTDLHKIQTSLSSSSEHSLELNPQPSRHYPESQKEKDKDTVDVTANELRKFANELSTAGWLDMDVDTDAQPSDCPESKDYSTLVDTILKQTLYASKTLANGNNIVKDYCQSGLKKTEEKDIQLDDTQSENEKVVTVTTTERDNTVGSCNNGQDLDNSLPSEAVGSESVIGDLATAMEVNSSSSPSVLTAEESNSSALVCPEGQSEQSSTSGQVCPFFTVEQSNMSGQQCTEGQIEQSNMSGQQSPVHTEQSTASAQACLESQSEAMLSMKIKVLSVDESNCLSNLFSEPSSAIYCDSDDSDSEAFVTGLEHQLPVRSIETQTTRNGEKEETTNLTELLDERWCPIYVDISDDSDVEYVTDATICQVQSPEQVSVLDREERTSSPNTSDSSDMGFVNSLQSDSTVAVYQVQTTGDFSVLNREEMTSSANTSDTTEVRSFGFVNSPQSQSEPAIHQVQTPEKLPVNDRGTILTPSAEKTVEFDESVVTKRQKRPKLEREIGTQSNRKDNAATPNKNTVKRGHNKHKQKDSNGHSTHSQSQSQKQRSKHHTLSASRGRSHQTVKKRDYLVDDLEIPNPKPSRSAVTVKKRDKVDDLEIPNPKPSRSAVTVKKRDKVDDLEIPNPKPSHSGVKSSSLISLAASTKKRMTQERPGERPVKKTPRASLRTENDNSSRMYQPLPSKTEKELLQNRHVDQDAENAICASAGRKKTLMSLSAFIKKGTTEESLGRENGNNFTLHRIYQPLPSKTKETKSPQERHDDQDTENTTSALAELKKTLTWSETLITAEPPRANNCSARDKSDSARDKVKRSWEGSFVPTATYRRRRTSSGSDSAAKSPRSPDDAQEGEDTRRRNASGEGASEWGKHPPSSSGKRLKKHAKRPRSLDALEDKETQKSVSGKGASEHRTSSERSKREQHQPSSSSLPVKKPKKCTRTMHRSFSLNELRREAEMMSGPNLTPHEKTEMGLAVVERYKQRHLSETPH